MLSHPVAGSWEDRLSKNDRSLAGSDNSTFDKEIILAYNTVVRESTERCDVLLNCISISSSVVGNSSAGSSTDSIDLLVDFGTAVVTELTTASNCPFDSSGVPSSDTSDLTKTSVSLTRKSVDTKSLDNTLGSFTFSNTDCVNTFIVLEDFTNRDFLLEFGESPVNLLGNVTSINLDFHNV